MLAATDCVPSTFALNTVPDKSRPTPEQSRVTPANSPLSISPTPSKDNESLTKEKKVAVKFLNALELDCLIIKERDLFNEQINKILKPNKRSAATLVKVCKHLINIVQSKKVRIGIFKDAIEWAKVAQNSTVDNKIGLFVKKIKDETGFNSSGRLLK